MNKSNENVFYLWSKQAELALTTKYWSRTLPKRAEILCQHINLDDRLLIINAIGEGQEHIDLVELMLERLNLSPSQVKIILSIDPKNRLQNYNVVVDHRSCINANSWYSRLKKVNVDWKNIKLNYKLVALCRRPDPPRHLYIKTILDNFKNDSVVSFGYKPNMDPKLIEAMKPHNVPIVLDIPLELSNPEAEQMIASGPPHKVFETLFHVVMETSNPKINEILISEKSYKPFAWYQLPIYVARTEHINELRKMDFDLFDDILDGHRYSMSINNPLSILSILNKLFKKYPTLDDMQMLRNQIWDRLEYNNNLLSKYISESTYKWPINE